MFHAGSLFSTRKWWRSTRQCLAFWLEELDDFMARMRVVFEGAGLKEVGVDQRATELVVRLDLWFRECRAFGETRKGEFRCLMIASEGVCKTRWLKEAISFLCRWFWGKKVGISFCLLDFLSNFNSHPHLVSFVLPSLRGTLGECSVLLLLLLMWPFSCPPHFEIYWRGALMSWMELMGKYGVDG